MGTATYTRITMSKSQGKAKGRKSSGKQPGVPVVNWADRLAVLRRTVIDPGQRRSMAVAHGKVLKEFDDWKRTICSMVMRESDLEPKADGDFTFIIPPSIVRLCYEAMLKQYMNAKRADRNEAIRELRDKLQADNAKIEEAVALADKKDAAKVIAHKEHDLDADKPRAGFVMEVKRDGV